MSKEEVVLKARPMAMGRFVGAPVDIIVPFHGQYDRVGTLLKSLWNGTRSNDYQITLVDDASPNTNFTEEMEKAKIPRLHIVRHTEQKGFGASLFSGYKATKNPWVVFMHSDCVIEDINWLLAMGETYHNLRTQGVKLVSSRLSNPTGGDPRVKGLRSTKTKDIVLSPEKGSDIVDKDMYVPLVCTLCHRDLFHYLNAFVKPYPYGWYEDLEFACRMFASGFKQGISGQSYVHHEGGATFNALFGSVLESSKTVEGNFHRATRDIRSMGIL